MKYKIEGTKYARDSNNMAVLCTDRTEVQKYNIELQKHKENQLRDAEINTLKTEISEIKNMLHQILSRG
jgi:hypothetical protein